MMPRDKWTNEALAYLHGKCSLPVLLYLCLEFLGFLQRWFWLLSIIMMISGRVFGIVLTFVFYPLEWPFEVHVCAFFYMIRSIWERS